MVWLRLWIADMPSQTSAAHPQAVLCDVDGTLLDSNAQHAEAWQKAFEHFGISTTFKQVLQQIGKGGDNLIPVFVPEPDRARLQKPLEEYRKELFRREYLPHIKAFPGARDLLLRMKSTGIRIAIASSSNKNDLKKFEEIADITDLVDEETSSDDAKRSKPAPDIFEATLDRLSLPADRVIALGDTPWDIEAAGKAGVKTVAVTSGGWSEHDLRTAGAIEVYSSVSEVSRNFNQSSFIRCNDIAE
jgi:HAD superfamily hydrolase (TIGR01509 family)